MKSKKLNLLTKRMSSLRLIANEIRVIYIIYGAVILLSFIAPYSHIFFDKASTIKVFGFNNLRTFMYAIGLPCSILVCSYLLIISNIRAKTKLNRVAGYLFLYSSIFHFIWIFWPGSDLPENAYYFSIAISSLVAVIFIRLLIKKRQQAEMFERNTSEFIEAVRAKIGS